MPIVPSDWGFLLPRGPLIELLIRPTVVYFFLLACLRLFARRQVSRLGLSDLLILFLLATAVRHGLTGHYTFPCPVGKRWRTAPAAAMSVMHSAAAEDVSMK